MRVAPTELPLPHRGGRQGRSPPLYRTAVDPAIRDFPEIQASTALHHSAGYRTLGIRERIDQHHGRVRHRLPRTPRPDTPAPGPGANR